MLNRCILTTVLVVGLAGNGFGQSRPRLAAARTKVAPQIDGILDDEVWERAAVIRNFVQRTPESGAAPHQKSEARVLYTTDTIYVGVRLWDEHPELIRRSLGLRDDLPDSDYVTVYLDPLLSGRRGYFFRVNAAGLVSEGLIVNETELDPSWNGVWDVEVKLDASGWTAEFRIPLTSLAFQDSTLQGWGFYVERYVQRSKEVSGWPAMDKTGSNKFVSRFAVLDGLRDLRREHSLYIQPYSGLEFLLARSDTSLRPPQLIRPNAGLDLIYTTHGGQRFVFALNPDFGEVEEDPAVLNLTPSEVFLKERRPFFTAGMDLFATEKPLVFYTTFGKSMPLTFLYTRRIGATPTVPEASSGATLTELDPNARILTAGKWLADLGEYGSYGALSVVEMPVHAVETYPDGHYLGRDVTPWVHYGALRSRVPLGSKAMLGFIGTSMTPMTSGGTGGYVGALEFDSKSSTGWQATALLSGSSTATGMGYGTFLRTGLRGAPPWRCWLEGEVYSKDYNVNDVGYLWRTDMIQGRLYLEGQLTSPRWIFRDATLTLMGLYGSQYSDPSVSYERIAELDLWGMFNNGWEATAGTIAHLPRMDDLETKGGPPLPRPYTQSFWASVRSDSSRRFWSDLFAHITKVGEGYFFYGTLLFNLSAFKRLTAAVAGTGTFVRGVPFWLGVLDQTAGSHLIADRDIDMIDISALATLGLHPRLTFRLYTQLFYMVSRDTNYQQLTRNQQGESILTPTVYNDSTDSSRMSLLLQALLRWDLRYGSAATLVYSLNGVLDGTGPAPFDFYGTWSQLIQHQQTHRLLLKISYAWDV